MRVPISSVRAYRGNNLLEERELLDARLKEDDDDPDAAIPWAEASAELLRER